MTRKQDSAKAKITAEDLKQLLAEGRDLLKVIVEETLQRVLLLASALGPLRKFNLAHP